MKQVIHDIYWEVTVELEKIQKRKLLLSERVALEKALAKLDSIKKIINRCNINPTT
jgi:hypothetical protein